MPFDFGQSVNYLADRITSSNFVGTVSQNPIYTALVCVSVIILITIVIFRDVESDESLLVLALRTGFWSFIVLSGVFVIHNRVLMREKAAGTQDGIIGSMFTGAGSSYSDPYSGYGSTNIMDSLNFENAQATQRLDFTAA